ncbi:hypothetical protein M2454_002942 [Aequitasia blattaphilus]|uniref:Uncharacterized protein n=1 Tax=Aequitasia blattaphilus TaxID=2949332 RepID=A0ABT1ECR8_9FIRM|nr:hypothetical protein [Aequitasia blattaphilus]MCP1103593.1 hypothetical protein [Aequitasia blattaphilus]MCR8616233.1 hypothetical protein [Aequitasia blattaphilus]
MINTTPEYKKAIMEDNRELTILDRFTMEHRDVIGVTNDDFMAYSINEATSANNKFSIGEAVIKKYTATLNNADDKFTLQRFEGTDILARIGLKLPTGDTEILRKGTFRVISAKKQDLTIKLEAYDSMLFFDRPYSESTLRYPATIQQIIADASRVCEVGYRANSIPLPNYRVEKRPDDETLTFRDVVSYCAQLMCCYARINVSDALEFGWYKFNAFDAETNLSGGIYDIENPNRYVSGDSAAGGIFMEGGDSFSGGVFDGYGDYFHLYTLGSQNINTDDVTFTGVKVTASAEKEEDRDSYFYGSEGYVLSIDNNPFIEKGKSRQVAEYIGAKIVGQIIRPLSITCKSDPSIESGDCALVTDRQQRSYRSVITNTTFTMGAMQKIECDAENYYTKYSAETKLLYKSKQDTDFRLREYDLEAMRFGGLMASAMGLYESEDIDELDGSKIKYMHDKPRLEDSQVIWKQTLDAFAVSTDGGQTWNGGHDKDGNVLATVLTAIGVNAEWIQTGIVRDKTGKNYWNLNTGAFNMESLNVQFTNINNTLSSKVTAGQVNSLIEQSASSIRLEASQISWKSTYSEMTAAGKLTCTGAIINGALKTNDSLRYMNLEAGKLKGGFNNQEYGYINFHVPMQGDWGTKGMAMYAEDVLFLQANRIVLQAGGISTGLSRDATTTYRAASDATIPIIKEIAQDASGRITSITRGQITVKNGLVTTTG